jgi:cytochrome c peroxidase
VPIPKNNPQSPEKIALGDKLFHDARFSVGGKVSCSKRHDGKHAFTDAKTVSESHNGLTVTCNAPTVVNAAFYSSQFWDERQPDFEGQAKQPLINALENGLKDYEPLLAIVRTDKDYVNQFQQVFGDTGKAITIATRRDAE